MEKPGRQPGPTHSLQPYHTQQPGWSQYDPGRKNGAWSWSPLSLKPGTGFPFNISGPLLPVQTHTHIRASFLWLIGNILLRLLHTSSFSALYVGGGEHSILTFPIGFDGRYFCPTPPTGKGLERRRSSVIICFTAPRPNCAPIEPGIQHFYTFLGSPVRVCGKLIKRKSEEACFNAA